MLQCLLYPQGYFAGEKKPSADKLNPSIDTLGSKGSPIHRTQSAAATPNSQATPDAAANTPGLTPTLLGKLKRGIHRRLGNFGLALTILGTLGFGSGIWYSCVNDKFYNLFIEHIPFGKRAMPYLLDFRKGPPNNIDRMPEASVTGVTVHTTSGDSGKVADAGEPANRQSRAVSKGKTKTKEYDAKLSQTKNGETKLQSINPATKPLKVETKESVVELRLMTGGEARPQGVKSPVSSPLNVEDTTDTPAKVAPPAAYSAKPVEPEPKLGRKPAADSESKVSEVN